MNKSKFNLPNELSNEELHYLLDQIIETALTGFKNIKKSYCMSYPNPPKYIDNLPDKEQVFIWKRELAKSIKLLHDVSSNIHQMLQNMTKLMSETAKKFPTPVDTKPSKYDSVYSSVCSEKSYRTNSNMGSVRTNSCQTINSKPSTANKSSLCCAQNIRRLSNNASQILGNDECQYRNLNGQPVNSNYRSGKSCYGQGWYYRSHNSSISSKLPIKSTVNIDKSQTETKLSCSNTKCPNHNFGTISSEKFINSLSYQPIEKSKLNLDQSKRSNDNNKNVEKEKFQNSNNISEIYKQISDRRRQIHALTMIHKKLIENKNKHLMGSAKISSISDGGRSGRSSILKCSNNNTKSQNSTPVQNVKSTAPVVQISGINDKFMHICSCCHKPITK